MSDIQVQGNDCNVRVVCSTAIDFSLLRVALTSKNRDELETWLFDIFDTDNLPVDIAEAVAQEYHENGWKFQEVIGLVLATLDFREARCALQTIDELGQITLEFKVFVPPGDDIAWVCGRILTAVSDNDLLEYYKDDQVKMSYLVHEGIYLNRFLDCLERRVPFSLTAAQQKFAAESGICDEVFMLNLSAQMLATPSNCEKAGGLIIEINAPHYRSIADIYLGQPLEGPTILMFSGETAFSLFLTKLAADEELAFSDIAKFLRAVSDMQPRLTSESMENSGLIAVAHDFSLFVAVYTRLKNLRPSEISKKALTFMEIQSAPIAKTEYLLRSYEDVEAQLNDGDFLFFAQHSWEYCIYYLFAFRDSLPKLDLRCMFLHLLCLDDGGELLSAGILDEDERADSDVIFKHIFYGSGNKQSVAAAYRVTYNWLNNRTKDLVGVDKWALAPNPNDVIAGNLAYFYSHIVGDIANHQRFADLEIAQRFTTTLYGYLNEIEYDNMPAALLFFVSYFTKNETEKVALYEQVMQMRGEYCVVAANNVIASYLTRGHLDKAKEALALVSNESWHNSRAAQIEEFERKTKAFQAMVPVTKEAVKIADIGDADLLYLYAGCSAACSARRSLVEHSEAQLTSWLLPHYNESHKLIYALIKSSLLCVEGDSIGNLKETQATRYDITSLPLRPNVVGFYEIELFLYDLKEEIAQREFEAPLLDNMHSILKIGWFLNAYEFYVNKYSYGRYMRAFTVEEMDLIDENIRKFSAAQLSSMAYSAVNFVAGSQKSYRFNDEQAANRIANRLVKNLQDFDPNQFVGKVFGRNNAPVFGLESALYLVDGKSMKDRYETC